MRQLSMVPRFVVAYCAAVAASALGATAALALFGFVLSGGANVAELPVVLGYALLYSAVGVAVLGPIGWFGLDRAARLTRGGYVVAGAILGLCGGALLTGGAFALGAPFLVAGALAGAAAAVAFCVSFESVARVA